MLPFLGIKDYIYGAVILLLTASIIFLKLSLSSAQVENMRLEKQITSYDTAIAEAEHNKEMKQIEVIKEVQVVKTEVQTKIQKVKEYVADTNKSDCANAMDFSRITF